MSAEPLTPEELELLGSRYRDGQRLQINPAQADRLVLTAAALSQELKAAREERDLWRGVVDDARTASLHEFYTVVKRADAAEAEVQRLREQLQRIADPDEITPPRLIAYNALLAAAALTEPEETK